MENNKKVLLRLTNLKQYFPLKKRGLFVKANDGISLDIYEGEVFGLVGESGCGKSTLGRTLLQLYRQTDGRTMYYGRTIMDVAPKYMKDTICNADKMRKRLAIQESRRDALQVQYDAADEKGRFALHAELDAAVKEAHDTLLDMANLLGGFVALPEVIRAKELYLSLYNLAKERHGMELRIRELECRLADLVYICEKKGATKTPRILKLEEKLVRNKEALAANGAKIEQVNADLNALRATFASDPGFARFEALRDDGIDLARLTNSEMRHLRSDLQLIFQDPYSSLNPRMTVGQIIGEGMIAHNYFKTNNERMQEEVLRVMDECGLQGYFLHRYPHQLSGGQRQRIGIARSLAVRPKFVVCDEAVSALDVSIQSQIINLLQDLRQKSNLTYMFITHDLSVVKYISDRIGVMYLGNMVELAESQEIFDHPMHPYTEALLSAIPTTDPDANRELRILEGDIPSPVNPPKGCKFHTRCSYCTEICRHVTPEWEEVRPGHFVACHHKLSAGDNQ